MDFFEAAATRRTVRDFLAEPVPDEVLARCLEAARQAPSSSNLQPWEFVVLREPEARRRADAICLGQASVRSAPLLVAVVARWDTWRRNRDHILETFAARGTLRPSQVRYYRRLIPLVYTNGPWNLLGWWKRPVGRLVSLVRPCPSPMTRGDVRVIANKSTALAAATFMLALRAEGFDSCPMEGFDPWRAKRLLGLGRDAEVCMFIAVGQRSPRGVYGERVLVPAAWAVRQV